MSLRKGGIVSGGWQSDGGEDEDGPALLWLMPHAPALLLSFSPSHSPTLTSPPLLTNFNMLFPQYGPSPLVPLIALSCASLLSISIPCPYTPLPHRLIPLQPTHSHPLPSPSHPPVFPVYFPHPSSINGTLPTLLGGLLKLESIDLSNNRLHGTIPTQYTGLVRLTLLNLRNNQLTGPVLEPIPSNLTVYNLDNNYLSSGFSSPPNCFQGVISFRFNCLETPTEGFSCPTPATPSAADAAVQRPEELCGVFCGVSAADPPCGGHGSCYMDGPNRVPTCDCHPGFVNGKLPGSCVPEGSQESGPVLVQPTAAQTAVKGGAAVANDGRITLTASQPNTWGAAFLQLPIPLFSFALKAGACGRPWAFTVYFSFSIFKPATSRRAAATAAGDAGDGFAFVIAASDTATGGSSASSDGSGGGGSLGYAGMDERSIAVEFDTAKSTDANDPNKNHVGPKHAWIVFNPSPSSSASTGYGSSCSSGSGRLRVFLSAKAPPRPSKAVVAMQVSLCEFLQPTAEEVSFLMGFSASSSDSPQLHSILAWNITTGTYFSSLKLSDVPSLSLCLPESTTLTGQQFGFRFSESSLAPVGANLFFRYASVGMQAVQPAGGGGGGEEVWVLTTGNSQLWAAQKPTLSSHIFNLSLLPLPASPLLGDCWAYAVVGSVEVAYSILFNLSAVPLLSHTQLHEALGSSCSQGNSPSQAFQYLVTLNAKSKAGLAEDGAGVVVRGGVGRKRSGKSPLYCMAVLGLHVVVIPSPPPTWPYPSSPPHPPRQSKLLGGPFRVDGFERTAFHGWFGLLLAAQRQPVVVHVQATAPSFLHHDGLSKYADQSCFTYNLNHVVLLVGYRLTGSDPTFPHMAPPFWIIRNSWGPEWGDGGHMRMDIQGGDGVCGINTLPGIYPVVHAAKDPCNVNGTTSGMFGPLFNPCGNFTCTPTPDGASNHCDCNDPRFVEALQPDNSRTCAYSERPPLCLQAALHNPCAVGTCVNDGEGSYSCVCPPGFRQGTTVEGTFSCALGDSSSTYTVVSWGVTCADIHPVYGLALAQLLAQNPGLSCSAPLAIGTVVNRVQPADLTPCSVYYTTSEGDTCESLATYFSLTAGCPTPTEPCAAAFQALNPGLDCSGDSNGVLLPSQAVCVERRAESAAALLIPVCSQFYLVQAGETCNQIRSVPSPPLSPLEFFRLNPGIKCSRLVPKTDVGSITGFETMRTICAVLSAAAHSACMHTHLQFHLTVMYLCAAGYLPTYVLTTSMHFSPCTLSPPLSPCPRPLPPPPHPHLTARQVQACIGSSFSFMQGVCPKTRAYVVGIGDRCTGLQVKYFHGIKGCYRKTNGYDCIDKLVKSTGVCIPDQVKIKAGKCEP
ncbi:unnamed protein product [Closterium sp. Naga37s-1]|nr:unnamed protein product [Closterium sp. Naga37s-1]